MIQLQAFQRTILTYDPANPAGFQTERANTGTDFFSVFPEQFPLLALGARHKWEGEGSLLLGAPPPDPLTFGALGPAHGVDTEWRSVQNRVLASRAIPTPPRGPRAALRGPNPGAIRRTQLRRRGQAFSGWRAAAGRLDWGGRPAGGPRPCAAGRRQQ
jgi:hypothetical protein